MHLADFFEDDTFVNGISALFAGRSGGPMLKFSLLDQIIAGPLAEEPDLSVAEGLFDLVEHELIAYGTNGSHLTDHDSTRIIRALEVVTRRLGMPVNLPFRDFRCRPVVGSGRIDRMLHRRLLLEVIPDLGQDSGVTDGAAR